MKVFLHIFPTFRELRDWMCDYSSRNPSAIVLLANAEIQLNGMRLLCRVYDDTFVQKTRGLEIHDYELHRLTVPARIIQYLECRKRL